MWIKPRNTTVQIDVLSCSDQEQTFKGLNRALIRTQFWIQKYAWCDATNERGRLQKTLNLG